MKIELNLSQAQVDYLEIIWGTSAEHAILTLISAACNGVSSPMTMDRTWIQHLVEEDGLDDRVFDALAKGNFVKEGKYRFVSVNEKKN